MPNIFIRLEAGLADGRAVDASLPGVQGTAEGFRVVSGLIQRAAVGAASAFVPGTPLGRRERPVCQCPAGGAVFLDRVLPFGIRQFTIVDEEGFVAPAAFAFEDVCGHGSRRL